MKQAFFSPANIRLSIEIALIAFILFLPRLALANDRADIGWQWVENGAVLVDVRTFQEFSEKHLDGAINLPVQDIAQLSDALDRAQPIVVYCRSGARSGRAQAWLLENGFSQVHNAGGLQEMLAAKPN